VPHPRVGFFSNFPRSLSSLSLKMAPETKSRKPANTAFKQQRLKAWQPILTPKTVLPTFFIVGIIFAPLGGLLLYASNSVNEIQFDYTFCDQKPPAPDDLLGQVPKFQQVPADSITSSFSNSDLNAQWARVVKNLPLEYDPTQTRKIWNCLIQFNLPVNLKPPVFMYYRLTNFYQNHRRYVKSFDANQLKGEAVPAATIKAGSCKPMDSVDDKIIYPCGLIANSLFNDTFFTPILLNSPGSDAQNETYEFASKGIAWPSDKEKYGKTKYTIDQIRPPLDWVERYPNGTYTEQFPPPNIAEDEHFQVWMRTAGLPDFRKLWGKNEKDTMKMGQYQVEIQYLFPVTKYGGTKSLVISTVSFLGGKNSFLGWAYIVVGVICVVLGCLFTLRHLYKPRKLGDHTYLSWNNNGQSSGSNN